MVLVVAFKVTSPVEIPRNILESEPSDLIRAYNIKIKVDKEEVICGCPLRAAYAVGIMAGITWCFFINNMFLVIIKRIIIQN